MIQITNNYGQTSKVKEKTLQLLRVTVGHSNKTHESNYGKCFKQLFLIVYTKENTDNLPTLESSQSPTIDSIYS